MRPAGPGSSVLSGESGTPGGDAGPSAPTPTDVVKAHPLRPVVMPRQVDQLAADLHGGQVDEAAHRCGLNVLKCPE